MGLVGRLTLIAKDLSCARENGSHLAKFQRLPLRTGTAGAVPLHKD